VPNGVQLFGTNVDVTLNYDGATLSATLFDGTNTATFTPPGGVLDLPALLGGQAFLGFTGATGGLSAQQSISNFQFSTPQGTTYANNVELPVGVNANINVAATASAFAITMGSLTVNNGSSLTIGPDASTPANQAYSLTFGPTSIAGNALISVANNGSGFGSLTLGAVSGSGATLSKLGTGTLILPAAGTYSGGTNINAGRLIATNTAGSATGSGLVNVNTNATLGGTGIIGGNIQVSGGTIAPGNPLFPALAPGRLTANQNVTFSSGTLQVKLNGTTAGIEYDQLFVTGTVSIGNEVTTLSTSLGYAPAPTDSLIIIQGGAVSAGQFVGLPNNTEFVVGTFSGIPYTGMIQYTANSVFISNFQPVPEPAHMLFLGGAIGVMWRWRRRRAPP
jgi:fibronectin-binding autotransporter adhesin